MTVLPSSFCTGCAHIQANRSSVFHDFLLCTPGRAMAGPNFSPSAVQPGAGNLPFMSLLQGFKRGRVLRHSCEHSQPGTYHGCLLTRINFISKSDSRGGKRKTKIIVGRPNHLTVGPSIQWKHKFPVQTVLQISKDSIPKMKAEPGLGLSVRLV